MTQNDNGGDQTAYNISHTLMTSVNIKKESFFL